MARPKTVETAFNFALGEVLRRKHPRWPDRIGVEQTNVLSESKSLQPDVIVTHPGGLPVLIETEFVPASGVEQDACERLGKTLRETGDKIEQTLAVRIPSALASTDQSQLEKAIERATLEFCVISGVPENPNRWPKTGWIDGGVDDLAGCIELVALAENRITRGMEILEYGIEQAANLLRDACADAPDTLGSIAESLHQKDGKQTSRMAMAILTNALTFHMSIAGANEIATLDELRDGHGRLSKTKTLKIWRHILKKINYWPIFKIASDILYPIRDGTAHKLLEKLSQVASELDELGATSQHDLCGRMFQRLITDRKFLATFYTLPSSAALLADLAIDRLDIDWSDREAITALRIGDFACGTGALLNAAYGSVLSRYRRNKGDDRDLHPEIMEHTLIGTDIMPAATHLTASMLSSTHPSVTFTNTSIITLPYGKQPERSGRQPVALGALDLIEKEKTMSLFDTGQRKIRGIEGELDKNVRLPHGGFDLVIMNPPFTRPTNHKKTKVPVPSFAGFSTSSDEQKKMSDRLKSIRSRNADMVGHGNAGLASYFIDIAHAKLKEGGVLALVLPASFAQGASWAAARNLLKKHYKEVVIISIVTNKKVTEYAFSADTGMAEVLVVATKKDGTEQISDRALFVNLVNRPKSILEAKVVARAVRQIPADRPIEYMGPIMVGNKEKVGQIIKGPMEDTGCAGAREVSVVHAAAGLVRGELPLPQYQEAIPLPIVQLGQLGDRGLLHRDINGKTPSGLPRGPFDIVDIQPDEVPTYPTLWRHDARRERQMRVLPDTKGQVRKGCDERAVGAWKRTASHLHFNLEFGLNSQSLAACFTPEVSMGGRAWPNFLNAKPRWDFPLVLWANTTLGLISFWWLGTRQHPGRAMVSISRLPSLAVLDVRSLTKEQLDHAAAIFNKFKNKELRPASEAWKDKERHALDRAVLVDLLGLPENILEPLALLRRQWCAEPSVSRKKRNAKPSDIDESILGAFESST